MAADRRKRGGKQAKAHEATLTACRRYWLRLLVIALLFGALCTWHLAQKVHEYEQPASATATQPQKDEAREAPKRFLPTAPQSEEPQIALIAERPATPAPPLIQTELSAGRPAWADVRGNLGPASVVTGAGPPGDWIKDRWQAAKDMSGTPIKGEHWIAVDLGEGGFHLSMAVLDFESACAKQYALETSEDKGGPWKLLVGVAGSIKPTRIVTREQHVVHMIEAPDGKPWAAYQFVRVRLISPATMWGISIWRFKLFGVPASGKL